MIQVFKKSFDAALGLCFLFLVLPSNLYSESLYKNTFPRLLGMNIGAKNYDSEEYQKKLARLDIAILAFMPGWKAKNNSAKEIRKAVRKLKQLNPDILLGQYTIMNESYSDLEDYSAHKDKIDKINNEDWWLRNKQGKKVAWTNRYPVHEVNFLEWSTPDAFGRRYPEWLAIRDYKLFFSPVPEFDIWYFDNVMRGPRIASAKWKPDGKAESGNSPAIRAAYRRAHSKEWDTARELRPDIILMGNADNNLSYPEYRGRLQAVFLEGLMGKRWSIESRKGWYIMMNYYFAAAENTAPPHIVGFNVAGDPENYQFFRYAFTSCLMGNGYFSFTNKKKGYSSVPWFDEYNLDLGNAVDSPQTAPWYNGVYKRMFENGVVLVNPTPYRVEVKLDQPYYLLSGKQDKTTNTGKRVLRVSIPSRDGLVLSRMAISQ